MRSVVLLEQVGLFLQSPLSLRRERGSKPDIRRGRACPYPYSVTAVGGGEGVLRYGMMRVGRLDVALKDIGIEQVCHRSPSSSP